MSNRVRVISYNVNGIRAAMKKGFTEWVLENDFDIIGLQEVKALEQQADLNALRDAGYHIAWHAAEKKGYSGVAVFSKIEPKAVTEGMGNPAFDSEGRVLRIDFENWTLLNCYFPSGTSGDERQQVKYAFLDAFYDWVEELKQEQPNILVQGDFNIAHTEMDIHNPKSNKNTSGFLPEERAWMTKWLEEAGFVDSFRVQHPELEKYSWWSYRARARERNKGWRIDYQTVTEAMSNWIKDADLLNDAVHSDHCPCWVELEV